MQSTTRSTILVMFMSIWTVMYTYCQAYPPININIADTCDVQGSTVCVEFTAEEFTNVEGMNFLISFDPNILELVTPIDLTTSDWPDLATNGVFTIYDNISGSAYGKGNINFLIFEGPVTTLPAGSTIFSLCFRLIGQPGQTSPIFINTVKYEVDITQTSPINPLNGIPGSATVTNGSIKIKANDIFLLSSVCGTTNTADNNGTIRFTPTGGKAPYSYTINAGAPVAGIAEDQEVVISDVASGNYTIEITDADLKKFTKLVVVDKTQPFTYVVDVKNPSCFHTATQNGYIDIDITDGGLFTPDTYKYSWSNFEFDKDSIGDLGTGAYFVTITDLLGCKTLDTFNIAATPIDYQIDVINSICNDKRTGQISIFNVSGGSGSGYRHFFNGADRGPVNVFLNLAPGMYDVRVSDGSGCSTPTLKVTVDVERKHSFAISVKNVSCGGKQDGRILITATPTDIRYDWQLNFAGPINRGPTDNTYLNDTLKAGIYRILSLDKDGCRDTINATIIEPTPIFLRATVVQPDCSIKGEIRLNPTGGTGTYTYNWDPIQAPNTSQLTNLNGGTFKVTVTDGNGCQKDTTILLNNAGSLVISLSNVIDVSCDGKNDGRATVSVLSPNPIVIVWRDGAGNVLPQQTNTITNLAPGTYSVLVTDNTGCSNSEIFVIKPAAPFTVTANITQPKCKGDLGQIIVSIPSSATNVTYSWTLNGSPNIPIDTDNILNQSGGVYNLAIKYGTGCSKDTSFTVVDPAEVTFPAISTRKVTCFGRSDGQAAVQGLPADLTLRWSTGEVGPFALSFKEGQHYVIGTNSQGCKSDTVFFDILTFPLLKVDDIFSTITKPTCFGSSNGSITIAATGGTGVGYQYNWINPAISNPTISNLTAGSYIVEISDNNNCVSRDTVILTQPEALEGFVDLGSSIELNCKNTEEGKLVIGTRGGNPGLKTISWQSGIVTDNGAAIRLTAGTYCATVSDNKGCKDTVCYTLSAPQKLVGEINQPAPLSCNGSKTCISVKSLTGGTGNSYTFQINNGQRYPIDSCVTVFAGSYFISFIDSAGCSVDTLIQILQPDPIEVDLGLDIELQLGFPPATINTIVDNSIIVDSAFWTPNLGITCLNTSCLSVNVNPTTTTTYVITVVDANGCTGTDEVGVTVKEVRNVFFANAFSPNDDGFNDYFQVATGPGVEVVELFEVYDRWGNLMFSKENYQPDPASTDGWDGSLNGRRMDPGVFVYIARVRFIDGVISNYRGSVTLMDKRKN